MIYENPLSDTLCLSGQFRVDSITDCIYVSDIKTNRCIALSLELTQLSPSELSELLAQVGVELGETPRRIVL